jgi:hypothetical protein
LLSESEGARFTGRAAPDRARRAAGGNAAALAAELAAAAVSAAFFARYCSAADMAERTLCGAFAGAACSVRSCTDAGCCCGAVAPAALPAGPRAGCGWAPSAVLLVSPAAPAPAAVICLGGTAAGCWEAAFASPLRRGAVAHGAALAGSGLDRSTAATAARSGGGARRAAWDLLWSMAAAKRAAPLLSVLLPPPPDMSSIDVSASAAATCRA